MMDLPGENIFKKKNIAFTNDYGWLFQTKFMWQDWMSYGQKKNFRGAKFSSENFKNWIVRGPKVI